jgi:hypothetical protein
MTRPRTGFVAAQPSRRVSVLAAGCFGESYLLLFVPLAPQYEAVLPRPEHLARSGASIADIGTLLNALCAICGPVGISYLWRRVLWDPDDEMVLEVAVNGGADRLLTFNERDFSVARRFNMVEFINVAVAEKVARLRTASNFGERALRADIPAAPSSTCWFRISHPRPATN